MKKYLMDSNAFLAEGLRRTPPTAAPMLFLVKNLLSDFQMESILKQNNNKKKTTNKQTNKQKSIECMNQNNVFTLNISVS